MKFGIATPVLTRTSDGPEWLSTGTIEDVAEIVSAADRLGYDFCTCSEHVGIPDTEIGRRGAAYWDPLATFGFLAARTSTIRFVTWVLVLAYHHPLALAKRYGQLDLVSNGRLVLGVGVGTLREEFDALGATFEGRGERADDAIRAIRATWGRRIPEYHGRALRHRRARRRTPRAPHRRPDLGGRSHPAIAATRHRAGRRLDTVRAVARTSRRDAGVGPGASGVGARNRPLDVMVVGRGQSARRPGSCAPHARRRARRRHDASRGRVPRGFTRPLRRTARRVAAARVLGSAA